MTNRRSFLLLATAPIAASQTSRKPPANKTVRTAVIGGMTMTRIWQEIARLFEAESGLRLEIVVTGQRPQLAEAMRAGKVDALTMHSGDITSNLVAEGYATNMRPWTQNELIIAGPSSDPAGIRGLNSGAEAFRKIAAARANFVDFNGIGSREVCHKLWRLAEVQPVGGWVLKDESRDNLRILQFAARNNAYVVVGRIPVTHGKLKADNIEILVAGDPEMRRPYIVMEANPGKFPAVNATGARRLSDFLLSDTVQDFLRASPQNNRHGFPMFLPVKR